jgi:hypothetical protein
MVLAHVLHRSVSTEPFDGTLHRIDRPNSPVAAFRMPTFNFGDLQYVTSANLQLKCNPSSITSRVVMVTREAPEATDEIRVRIYSQCGMHL